MDDDAITRERLEAIGFKRGTYGFHIRGLLFVDTTIRGCPVYLGSVTNGAAPLDKIKTMTQLETLMKALNGEECAGEKLDLADSLLLERLEKLGMTKTVEAFQRLTKWYARVQGELPPT